MHRRPPSIRRLATVAAALTAAALVVTGCSASGSGDEEQTLYVLSTDTELGFDPATNVNLPTTWLGLVGRRLTTWGTDADGNVEVVPDLATDTGTSSEDGTVWTYTLKDDIFFEDGTPITSADIKYGVERTFAPELAGGLHYHNSLLVGGSEYTGPFEGEELASIETPDDKTIVFHLTQPYGDWPWLVSMNPFIPVPEGEGVDTATYAEKPVASGPYKVESNDTGTETVLVRNDEWSEDTDDVRTADPDRIVIRQSQNASTIAQTLISDTGEAKTATNAYPLSASELALVHADPAAEERLTTSEGGLFIYAALNNDSPELANPLVREAVQYAVDRSSIITALGGDEAAVATTTVIAPGVTGYEEFDLYPEDVDTAKDLLAEAGYPDGIALDLWVATGDTAVAEALQQSLAQAGITLNILPMDQSVMYGEAMGGNPDYDMFLSWWIGDYPSPAATVSLMFESKYVDGGYNLSRTVNADLDAAISEAIATTDASQSAEKWSAIDKMIMETGSIIPLYLTRNSFLRGSDVDEFRVAAYPAFQNYLTISLAE